MSEIGLITIGLVIGLVVGGTVVALVMGAMCSGSRRDDAMKRG